MAPNSENVTEQNLIQDSRNGVREYSTEHYFDIYKNVHENSQQIKSPDNIPKHINQDIIRK